MEAYTTDIKLPYCNVCKKFIRLRAGETAKNAVNRHVNGARHRTRAGPRPGPIGSVEHMIGGSVVLPAWLKKGAGG